MKQLGRVRLMDIARLPAHLFGASPPIVAVQRSGWFGGVAGPSGILGRIRGIAVGFVINASRRADWHLSFLTSDPTFGGPVVDFSIERVELTIWTAPGRVPARIGAPTTTSVPTATLKRTPAEEW